MDFFQLAKVPHLLTDNFEVTLDTLADTLESHVIDVLRNFNIKCINNTDILMIKEGAKI